MRCPDCAYIKSAVQAAAVTEPASFGMAAVAGVTTGLAGAYTLALLAFVMPLLSLLAAPLYGRLVADGIRSFDEGSSSARLEIVGVASILIGSLVAFESPFGCLRNSHGSIPELTQAVVGMAIGLSIAVCYHRLKPGK